MSKKRVTHPIWQRLIGAYQQNQLHHALLFSGPGSEKLAMAKAWANYLLCQNPTATSFCGHCQSCCYFKEAYHPDFLLLGEDIEHPPKIDDIRGLAEFISASAHTANHKVIVIAHAEKLNMPTQNALLKMLEEPPANVHFILLTDNEHLLLATVKSRCLSYIFKPVDIQTALKKLRQIAEDDEQYQLLKGYPDKDLLALLSLANNQVEDVSSWAQSPVWENREALIQTFVIGEPSQTKDLPKVFNRHAEQVLYFIYRALSEWIQQSMCQAPVQSYIIESSYSHSNAYRCSQTDLNYLMEVEKAIQSVTQMPSLNKLLLFQSLFAKRVAAQTSGV